MGEITIDKDLISYLRTAIRYNASDLHIKAFSPPRIRVNGELTPIKAPPLSPETTEQIVRSTMSEREWDYFIQTWEKDYSLDVEGIGRFRLNAFYSRGNVEMIARSVLGEAPSISSLGLPNSVSILAKERNGMIVVSGPTGSGKTTTLAGIVDQINSSRKAHIVTIEDPIEIIHHDKKSSVSQRELSSDTKDYMSGLRAALRQDPDVILLGEMRHEETVRTAIHAAQTGHLVLTTLHTTSAIGTISRIVDFFPEREQYQVRLSLSESLRGVVCQRLVPTVSKNERAVIADILINRGRVPEIIVDPTKGDLQEVMENGKSYGMQTFDDSLLYLLEAGTITMETAMNNTSDRHNFRLKSKVIQSRTQT